MQRFGYLLILITAAYVLCPCPVLHAQKTRIYTFEDVDLMQGIDLFEKEKFVAAQHYFEKVVQRTADKNSLTRIDAEYYAALCAVELFNKDAEDLLIRFIHDHPESGQVKMACFNLGKYKYRKKQYLEAIDWFDKVDVTELNKEETAEFYFKRGYSYFIKEEYEKSGKDLYEIKDIENKYAAPATFYYSIIEYRNKNYETALKGFQRLTSDENFGSIVPYYIAQIFYLQGKYDEVIKYSPPLLEDSAHAVQAPGVIKILAESFYRLGRYSESQAYFEKYLYETKAFTRSDWYELGYSYYVAGDTVKALNAFKNAANAEDSLAQNAFYLMADCYLRNKSKQMALDAFYNAYKINADKDIREDALFNYAKLSYELSYNPFSEAIKAFETYLKEYPNSSRNDEAYGFLVNVYLTTKNYEAALKSIENIKMLTPNLKAAYQQIAYYRGIQLFNDQQMQDAIRLFDKSLQYPIDKKYSALCKYWKGESCYRLAEKGRNTDLLENAIKSYKDFLFEPGAITLDVFNTANYSLGYAYFKEQKYSDANTWFRKFVSAKKQEPPLKMNDAYLRIADGFFKQKDYNNAADYYDRSLQLDLADVDYAMYQKGLVLGLLGKHEAKSKTLEALLAKFPGKTVYEAAAKYELGKSYEMQNNMDKAYAYYMRVIKEHPGSNYVAGSMLQAGNIQNKKGQYDAALNMLNDLYNKFPKSNEALEAVNIMHEVCKKKGDTDCLEKLRDLKGSNITASKLDSDNFEIAEDLYDSARYEEAYKAFSKYQQKFPDGRFLVDASFYKGEIDYQKNDLPEALTEYNYVIDKPQNKFTLLAVSRAAKIGFRMHNYDLALELYKRSERESGNTNDVQDAVTGEMRCNFLLSKYDDAIANANLLLPNKKLPPDLILETHMTLAKCLLAKQDYDGADKEFKTIMSLTQNEKYAEAKYNVALIQYSKAQYKESQKTVFELINQKPSYGYWVGKGFLLLSDDYIALGDRYNAKYTLKTFIDKSTNAELVEEAKTKLANIIEIEKTEQDNQQKKQEEQKQIQFNNSKDSLLFKENPGGGN